MRKVRWVISHGFCSKFHTLSSSAKFWKSVKIWQSYRQLKCGNFFETVFSVPAQETAKHRAKFGWRPLSDVAAVTKARRVTRWNLLGCRKLPNRSQLLMGRSSPYCGHMRRRYCCLTIIDTCLNCEDTARQSCAMVPRWRIFGDFFAFCISSEPRAAHIRPAF